MLLNIRSVFLIFVSFISMSGHASSSLETCKGYFDYVSTGVETRSDGSYVRVGEASIVRQTHFSRSRFFRFLFRRSSLEAELLPADGIGKILVFELTRQVEDRSWSLLESLRESPKTYAPYGMYSIGTKIFVPDTARLNHILSEQRLSTSNGFDILQFADVPLYKEQFYSKSYFAYRLIRDKAAIKASRDFDMDHDLIEQHLVGAVFMPRSSFHKMRLLTLYFNSLKRLQIFEVNSLLNSIVLEAEQSISSKWDSFTTEIGYRVFSSVASNIKDSDKLTSVEYVMESLKNLDRWLSVENAYVTSLDKNLLQELQGLPQPQRDQILNEVQSLKQKYLFPVSSEKRMEAEGFRFFERTVGWSILEFKNLYLKLKEKERR